MKKVALIIFIASVSGLIGGCSLFGQKPDETATTEVTPSPNASPSPAPTQPFGQGTQPSNSITVTELIPSTPPSQIVIQKGRSDPFALIPVTPTIKVEPNPDSTNPQPGNTVIPPTVGTFQPSGTSKTQTSATSKSKPSQSSGSAKSSSSSPIGSKSPAPVSKAPFVPPPPPEPTEAQSILVSGVVALPTGPVAIIKTADKNLERSVTPGSFVANGQVLVKAIYADSDNPVVILEQYGIEVVKKVGEAPIQASAPETPPQPPTPPAPEQS